MQYSNKVKKNCSVSATGVMKRSTSMSYVDGCVGTWPKEKRLVCEIWYMKSAPQKHSFTDLHTLGGLLFPCWTNCKLSASLSSSSRGISFEIPLDGDPTVPPCEAHSLRGMTRSASSDGLGFKVHYASRGGMKRHLSLMPVNVNGQSRHILEEDEDFTSHKPLGRNITLSVKNQSRYSRVGCVRLRLLNNRNICPLNFLFSIEKDRVLFFFLSTWN